MRFGIIMEIGKPLVLPQVCISAASVQRVYKDSGIRKAAASRGSLTAFQIRKGYVEKVQSPNDRREYHLRPTQKFHDYYNLSRAYIREVMDQVRDRFTPEEVNQMDRVLDVVGQEVMR